MALFQENKDTTKYQGRSWSDLDLNFGINPATKDIRKKVGENAIKQSIKNLLMTNKGEKPFQPEVFGGLYSYLFDPLHPFTASSMEQNIENVINTFEPRVRVDEVRVEENGAQDGYDIIIVFTLINTEQLIRVEFFLERLK